MRYLLLILVLLGTTSSVFSQGQRRGVQNRNRIPQQNQAPTDSQKESMKKKARERRQEYIANFLTTLEADDFQKEIIKQNLNGYFEASRAFMKIPFERSLERKDAFKAFKEDYFKELKTVISENDMIKINDMLDGKFKEKEVRKKKKRKKRRNRKKS